jgi:hypothetical protein
MADTITQLRSYRIGPFALFDFAASYAAAWYGAPYLKVSREKAMWLVIPAGIAVHELVGLKTPLNKMVVGPETNILAQLAIAGMVYKGVTS